MKRRAIEILLSKAELTGVPERRLLKSRNLGAVDLIWPRTGVARKSAAREMVFRCASADRPVRRRAHARPSRLSPPLSPQKFQASSTRPKSAAWSEPSSK